MASIDSNNPMKIAINVGNVGDIPIARRTIPYRVIVHKPAVIVNNHDGNGLNGNEIRTNLFLNGPIAIVIRQLIKVTAIKAKAKDGV